MSSPKTIRWGILATGGIAQTFTRDLLVDPTTRDVTDIKHTVVAAASSSSADRAAQFLKDVGAPSSAVAYGNYTDLVQDANIDVVYVATPHSHHYQNVRLALEAGKHVLCEKAFTVNAAQAKALIALAKEKGVFLMEAVWTRFFPLSIYVRDIIRSGKLGPVARVMADNSMGTDPEVSFADGKGRLVNPDLAGGALLDAGVYALTWVFQCLYTTQEVGKRVKPRVVSTQKMYEGPNVKRGAADEASTVVLSFERGREEGGVAHAVATTSLRVPSDYTDGVEGRVSEHSIPCIRIQGPKGEIHVYPPAYRPTKTKLIILEGAGITKGGKAFVEEKEWLQPGPGQGSGWKNGFSGDMNGEGEGHGMFWEADEVARKIVAGKQESEILSWEESIAIMEVMDEVRRQGGSVYPEKIETLDYPVEL